MNREILIKYFEKFYPTESHSSLTESQLLTKINDYRGFREGDSELGLEILNFGQPADLRKFSRNFLKSEVILKELQGKTQEATENTKGILSIEDLRKEESYLLGTSYDGVLGIDLKNIILGKSYLYIDSSGKGTVYEAILTKTSSTGFLAPDSINFKNITNSAMSYIQRDYSTFTMIIDKQSRLLHIQKRNLIKVSLQELENTIKSFIAENGYRLYDTAMIGNFNIVRYSTDANVYNAYAYYLLASNTFVFWYSESNAGVTDKTLFYFHSGKPSLRLELI